MSNILKSLVVGTVTLFSVSLIAGTAAEAGGTKRKSGSGSSMMRLGGPGTGQAMRLGGPTRSETQGSSSSFRPAIFEPGRCAFCSNERVREFFLTLDRDGNGRN